MNNSQRASCWSITINNPTAQDLKPDFPNNAWRMEGQIEKGEAGTEHYQAVLFTPQTRLASIKKILPRAHIEIAKNKKALLNYVHKAETRVTEVGEISNNIPTLFQYQHTIASKWNDDEFQAIRREHYERDETDEGNMALEYVDKLVARDIEQGVCGVEYIAVNPMWRSAWKRFWKAMVIREKKMLADSIDGQDIRQVDDASTQDITETESEESENEDD